MFAKLTLKIGAFELVLDDTDALKGVPTERQPAKIAAMMLLAHRSYEQYLAWVDGKPLQADLPPAAPAPAPAPVTAPGERAFQTAMTGYVAIDVLKVVHGHNEKGEFFKVYGGEWTKFGVVAYKDSCKDTAGMFALPLGVHEGDAVAGWKASVQTKGDDPLKVSEVRLG